MRLPLLKSIAVVAPSAVTACCDTGLLLTPSKLLALPRKLVAVITPTFILLVVVIPVTVAETASPKAFPTAFPVKLPTKRDAVRDPNVTLLP